jgi:hypothetical protein
MAGKRKSSGTSNGKKKIAMRTLKGKKGVLSEREARQIKAGAKLAVQQF